MVELPGDRMRWVGACLPVETRSVQSGYSHLLDKQYVPRLWTCPDQHLLCKHASTEGQNNPVVVFFFLAVLGYLPGVLYLRS